MEERGIMLAHLVSIQMLSTFAESLTRSVA
jgi:hypothetical protein